MYNDMYAGLIISSPRLRFIGRFKLSNVMYAVSIHVALHRLLCLLLKDALNNILTL